MCEHFCIGFIDFIKVCSTILIYFPLTNMKKRQNKTKIFLIDSRKIKIKNVYCEIFGKYKKLKNPKISYILKKNIFY